MLEAELGSIEAVRVEPPNEEIPAGQTAALKARVHFSDGLVLDGCRVSWTSDDEGVASVDDGEVSGTAEGAATITATFQGASGSAQVSVVPDA